MNSDPFIGANLGPYRLTRKLGQGGMGVVYHAIHDLLHVEVAVKLLPSHLATNEQYRARFFREAKAAATLDHPNVVRVLDAGFDEKTSQCYLIMAFCEGDTLRDRLARAWPVQQALPLFVLICDALIAAHDRGLIHRDVKPDNVLFTATGIPQISDFGLARMESSTSALTQTGQVLGTPPYMPLEQWDGDNVGPRADQYALGVTFYEVLTLDLPIWAETPSGYVRRLVAENRTPIFERKDAADLPRSVGEIVERMTAIEPEQRFESLADARDALVAASQELRISLQIDPGSAPRRIRGASTPTWTDISDRPTVQQISDAERDLSVFPLRQASVHNSMAGTPNPPVRSEVQTQADSSMVAAAVDPDAPTAVRPRKRRPLPALVGVLMGLLVAALVGGGVGVLVAENGGPDIDSDPNVEKAGPSGGEGANAIATTTDTEPLGDGTGSDAAVNAANGSVDGGFPTNPINRNLDADTPNTTGPDIVGDGGESNVAFKSDREFILANRGLALTRVASGRLESHCERVVMHPNGWQAVLIDGDEIGVASVRRDGAEDLTDWWTATEDICRAGVFTEDGTFYSGEASGELTRWHIGAESMGASVLDPMRVMMLGAPIHSLACAGEHMLLAGLEDGTSVVIDASRRRQRTSVLVAVLRGHEANSHVDVWLAPDGRSAVTAGGDQRVCLWDLSAARAVIEGDGDENSDADHDGIADADGERISEDPSGGRAPLQLDPIRSVRVGSPLNAVAVSQSYGLVVCGGLDGTVSVLHLDIAGSSPTWPVVETLIAHTSSVETLAFNKSESLLVSGGHDDVITLFTPVGPSGLDLIGRRGQAASIVRIAEADVDGNALDATWVDTTFGGQTIAVATGPGGLQVLTFAPSGHTLDDAGPGLAMGGARIDGEVVSLDIDDAGVWAVAVNSDRRAFFVHRDGRQFEIETGNVPPIVDACLVPNRPPDSPAAVVVNLNGSIHVHSIGLKSGTVQLADHLTGGPANVSCISMSPSGVFVAGGRDGEVVAWQLEEGGSTLLGMTHRKQVVDAVAFDGRYIYAACEDLTISLWAPMKGDEWEMVQFIDIPDRARSFHCAATGELVLHSERGGVRVVEQYNADQSGPSAAPNQEVFVDLACYADAASHTVAFGLYPGNGQTIVAWSPTLTNFSPAFDLAAPVLNPTAMAVTRDGSWLVVAGHSGQVRFLSLAPRQIRVNDEPIVWGLDCESAFFGETEIQGEVALRPNRTVEVTVTNDGDGAAVMLRGQIEFYRDEDGELLTTLPVVIGNVGSGETVTRTVPININWMRGGRSIDWPKAVVNFRDAGDRRGPVADGEGGEDEPGR